MCGGCLAQLQGQPGVDYAGFFRGRPPCQPGHDRAALERPCAHYRNAMKDISVA